jgi:hypothetical protein
MLAAAGSRIACAPIFVRPWIPACAGTTTGVIPATAGIQNDCALDGVILGSRLRGND